MGNVSLILNLSTGHVSPQYHVVFDKTFSTIPSLKNGSVPSSWTFVCENNRELATYNDFNLADLWSKSERGIGVKFDIQQESNRKIFLQPKDDALITCDTDHATKNAVTTVSQKSKSYLDAAKGSFDDTNNNKTFPARSISNQRFAENEVEWTAESHAAKMEVEKTAESPNNHQPFSTNLWSKIGLVGNVDDCRVIQMSVQPPSWRHMIQQSVLPHFPQIFWSKVDLVGNG